MRAAGKADFRGRNATVFAFFSSPGLQINIMTEERTFLLWSGEHHNQVVHGSFITRVFVRADARTPD